MVLNYIQSLPLNTNIDEALKKLLEESLMRVTVLGMENERLSFELESARRKTIAGTSDYDAKISQSIQNIREKDRELQAHNAVIQEKDRELHLLRQKVAKLEQEIFEKSQGDNENTILKAKITSLEVVIEQCEKEKETFQKEVNRLREHDKQNSIDLLKLNDQDARNGVVLRENEKLNHLLNERANELSSWQAKLAEANRTASRVPELDNKVRLLVAENERQDREAGGLKDRLQDAERRLHQLPEQPHILTDYPEFKFLLL